MGVVEKASQVLQSGGVIIYPTETVFAIGCLISFPKAIERLYQIKKRERNQPTSALFPNLASAKEFVSFNRASLRLADKFWPGALTICLPVKKPLPEMLLGPGKTLGIRVSSNRFVANLFKVIKEPILAPSANFRGMEPPKELAMIDKDLIKLIDYVVEIEPDGEKPSTVLRFVRYNTYQIIRQGKITKQMIDKALEKGD